MTAPISFNRTPYKVSYYDQEGVKQTIRRVPPAKLHDALPEDEVRLTQKRSDDFVEGESYRVKGINPKHPNTLQLENGDGQTTFVPYFNTELSRRVAMRDGKSVFDEPANNDYLLWP